MLIWRGMLSLFILLHLNSWMFFFLVIDLSLVSCPILLPTQLPYLSLGNHHLLFTTSLSLPPFVCFFLPRSHISLLFYMHKHTLTHPQTSTHTCSLRCWSICLSTSIIQALATPFNTHMKPHTHLSCVLLTAPQGRFCIFLAVRVEGGQRIDIASAGPRYS